jgi:hypothetical protein
MSNVRLPRPLLRNEFRARLRADLMNEAVALAEERRARPRGVAARVLSWWSAGRLRPVAVAAIAVAVLLAGTGAAAAGSLPGDAAYPLKRAVEEVEAALATAPEAKVEVLARHAQRRLDDLSKAASRGDRAPTASSEYEAAVQRLSAAVAALRAAEPGARREAIEQVVEAARAKHVQVLEQLKERVSPEAQRGIERALEEHGRLAPARGKTSDRAPKPSEAPGRAPAGSPLEDRKSEPPKEIISPRPSEAPRGGGRPSSLPTRP